LAQPAVAKILAEMGAIQTNTGTLPAADDPTEATVLPHVANPFLEEPDAVVPHVRFRGGPGRPNLPGLPDLPLPLPKKLSMQDSDPSPEPLVPSLFGSGSAELG